MSARTTSAIRFECDLSACGLVELVEGAETAKAKVPDGWLEIKNPTAWRLTFHTAVCLTRYVRSMDVSRRNGSAEMVGTVGYHLDDPEAA